MPYISRETVDHYLESIIAYVEEYGTTPGHTQSSPPPRALNGSTQMCWRPQICAHNISQDWVWELRSTLEKLLWKTSMTWSRLGEVRISSGGWWRHWVALAWKLRNNKWHFGNLIFLMMMMMMMAMAVRRWVGKAWEPTPAYDRNLFGQINLMQTTTLSPRTISPEPLNVCPGARENGW